MASLHKVLCFASHDMQEDIWKMSPAPSSLLLAFLFLFFFFLSLYWEGQQSGMEDNPGGLVFLLKQTLGGTHRTGENGQKLGSAAGKHMAPLCLTSIARLLCIAKSPQWVSSIAKVILVVPPGQCYVLRPYH